MVEEKKMEEKAPKEPAKVESAKVEAKPQKKVQPKAKTEKPAEKKAPPKKAPKKKVAPIKAKVSEITMEEFRRFKDAHERRREERRKFYEDIISQVKMGKALKVEGLTRGQALHLVRLAIKNKFEYKVDLKTGTVYLAPTLSIL